MTVIIITHKLYEVMEISDRVGVMRQGRLVSVNETKNMMNETGVHDGRKRSSVRSY